MKKQVLALVAVTASALTLTACMEQHSALNLPPGKYKNNTSTTDSNGTTRERQSSTDVMVDDYGNKKAIVHSKSTKDPRGLFNKSTTSESSQTIEESQ